MHDLGPYDLLEPAGAGAMGEVWRARHRREGVDVAIKVLTDRASRAEQAVRAFEREARATGLLLHPHIVRIYDYGVTPDGDHFHPGSPFLVMTWVDGGTLEGRARTLPWVEAARMLTELLSALACAHAAGVLHLDVKPSNVLLERSGAVRLADLGIARAMSPHLDLGPAAAPIAGTPGYMAPEQWSGRTWELGPWTDLHAVGVLAGQLVGESPPGFGPWMERLLAQHPDLRYRTAAEAAWELASLRAASPRPGRGAPSPVVPAATLTGDVPPLPLEPLDPAPTPSRLPPLPATWRSPAPERVLHGVGLGLFGLRSQRLVGRSREQRLLWTAARQVGEQRGAAALVLRGEAGVGKSRLAQWLLGQAAELGGWCPARTHRASGQRWSGLAHLVTDVLQCHGAPAFRLQNRLATALGRPPEELDDRLTLDLLDDGGPRLGTAPERHRAIAATLAAIAATRPIVAHLEDVHDDADALAVALHLLRAHGDAPVLLVLTVRDSALADHPAASDLIDRLLARPQSTDVCLGPLASTERHALVAELLGLAAPLAAAVDARTDGNPLFAIQLVGDWVDRGVLALSPEGFTLEDDDAIQLPERIDEVWRGRIEGVLEGLPHPAADALEIGALLGHVVEERVWRRAAPDADLDALLDGLMRRRLVEPTSGGWAFCHGMLCESLVLRARRRGRVQAWHGRCADALHQSLPAGPSLQARVGTHLLAAGRPAEAAHHLLEAGRALCTVGDAEASNALLGEADAALTEAGVAAQDHRWVLRWSTAAKNGRALRAVGQVAGLIAQVAEAIGPESSAWDRAELIQLRALTAADRGDVADSLALHLEASALFEQAGDPTRAAWALAHSGFNITVQKRRGEAREVFQRALALFEQADHPMGIATCLRGLAETWGRASPPTLRRLIERALVHYRAVGSRLGMSDCFVDLCIAAEAEGKLDEAADWARRALRLAGHTRVAFLPTYYLAWIHIRRGEVAAAEARLTDLASWGTHWRQDMVDVLRLACHHDADGEIWDPLFTRTEASYLLYPHMLRAEQLAHIADLARQAGRNERATAMDAMARNLRSSIEEAS